MKAHVGVDAGSGLVHTLVGTAANVADGVQAHALLHREEKAGFGDAGYQGVERRVEIVGGFGQVHWFVAAKRGKVKAMAEGQLKEATQAFEKAKAQLRAYVEHPFHVVKNLFKHRKVRLPGPGQEHRATPQLLRPGQPGACPTHSAIRNPGLNRQTIGKRPTKTGTAGNWTGALHSNYPTDALDYTPPSAAALISGSLEAVKLPKRQMSSLLFCSHLKPPQ